MAINNMDNYDGFYGQEPRLPMPKGEVAGEVKVLRDTYTLAAAFALNDELDMGFVPEGSTIIDCKVIIPASVGATGIFTVGYRAFVDSDGNTVSEDADALILSADAGGQAVFARMLAGVAGYGKKVGKGGAQIFATCTEVVGATGGQITIEVQYVND